jgi:hypothetical protein
MTFFLKKNKCLEPSSFLNSNYAGRSFNTPVDKLRLFRSLSTDKETKFLKSSLSKGKSLIFFNKTQKEQKKKLNLYRMLTNPSSALKNESLSGFDFPFFSTSSLTKSKKKTVKSETRSQIWTFSQTEEKSLCWLKNQSVAHFWNVSFDKGRLKNLVSWFLKHHGEKKTIQLLENLKQIGFGYATKAGVSLGIDDLKIPPKKKEAIYLAEKSTFDGLIQSQKGEITEVERFQRFIDTWHQTSETLKNEVIKHFEATDLLNPVYMMAFSGARGNLSQVRQLVGMRGLMADAQGQILDFPIRSNFREGLTLTEYIISSYGARKGIVDTALRTANAGYLTRRLVDVAQHVIVSTFDCGSSRGIYVSDMKEGRKTIYAFQKRLIGRVLATDFFFSSVFSTSSKSNFLLRDKNENKPVNKNLDVSVLLKKPQKLATRNTEISSELASVIANVTHKVLIRSPLTCQNPKQVCQLCYGWSLSDNRLVSIGEAVGVIAAQSIGEPGTQLTMRTFHTGGVFAGGITDQIMAPQTGFIYYPSVIAGICVRTPHGLIAFLTKEKGYLQIRSNPDKNEGEYLNIPSYTLLFIKQKQKVSQKQLIAQISSASLSSIQKTNSEQTVSSPMEGQIYSSHLQMIEKKNGFDDLTQETLNSGYVWILAGKTYEFPVCSSFFPKMGDLVKKNSIVNQLSWTIPEKNKQWFHFLDATSNNFTKKNFFAKWKSIQFRKFNPSPLDKTDRSFATSVDKLRLSRSLSTDVAKLRSAFLVHKNIDKSFFLKAKKRLFNFSFKLLNNQKFKSTHLSKIFFWKQFFQKKKNFPNLFWRWFQKNIFSKTFMLPNLGISQKKTGFVQFQSCFRTKTLKKVLLKKKQKETSVFFLQSNLKKETLLWNQKIFWTCLKSKPKNKKNVCFLTSLKKKLKIHAGRSFTTPVDKLLDKQSLSTDKETKFLKSGLSTEKHKLNKIRPSALTLTKSKKKNVFFYQTKPALKFISLTKPFLQLNLSKITYQKLGYMLTLAICSKKESLLLTNRSSFLKKSFKNSKGDFQFFMFNGFQKSNLTQKNTFLKSKSYAKNTIAWDPKPYFWGQWFPTSYKTNAGGIFQISTHFFETEPSFFQNQFSFFLPIFLKFLQSQNSIFFPWDPKEKPKGFPKPTNSTCLNFISGSFPLLLGSPKKRFYKKHNLLALTLTKSNSFSLTKSKKKKSSFFLNPSFPLSIFILGSNDFKNRPQKFSKDFMKTKTKMSNRLPITILFKPFFKLKTEDFHEFFYQVGMISNMFKQNYEIGSNVENNLSKINAFSMKKTRKKENTLSSFLWREMHWISQESGLFFTDLPNTKAKKNFNFSSFLIDKNENQTSLFDKGKKKEMVSNFKLYKKQSPVFYQVNRQGVKKPYVFKKNGFLKTSFCDKIYFQKKSVFHFDIMDSVKNKNSFFNISQINTTSEFGQKFGKMFFSKLFLKIFKNNEVLKKHSLSTACFSLQKPLLDKQTLFAKPVDKQSLSTDVAKLRSAFKFNKNTDKGSFVCFSKKHSWGFSPTDKLDRSFATTVDKLRLSRSLSTGVLKKSNYFSLTKSSYFSTQSKKTKSKKVKLRPALFSDFLNQARIHWYGLKQGWVYFTKKEKHVFGLHKSRIPAGKRFLGELIFESHQVYVQAFQTFSNLSTSLKFISFLSNSKKASLNEKKKSQENLSIFTLTNKISNQKPRYPKANFPLKFGYFLQKMDLEILPQNPQWKVLFLKHGCQFSKNQSSLLLFESFHSVFLNKQKTSSKVFSTFPEPDFLFYSVPFGLNLKPTSVVSLEENWQKNNNLEEKISFNFPQKKEISSIFNNKVWKKNFTNFQTWENRKSVLGNFYQSQVFKSQFFLPIHPFSKKLETSLELESKLTFSFPQIKLDEHIYFSEQCFQLFPLIVGVTLPSYLNGTLKSTLFNNFFSAQRFTKKKEISLKATHTNLKIDSGFDISFLDSLEFQKHFLCPSLSVSFLKNRSFFCDQKLFSPLENSCFTVLSPFLKKVGNFQDLEKSSFLPLLDRSTTFPKRKNEISLFSHSSALVNPVLGLTSFYSPLEGELLHNWTIDEELNSKKKRSLFLTPKNFFSYSLYAKFRKKSQETAFCFSTSSNKNNLTSTNKSSLKSHSFLKECENFPKHVFFNVFGISNVFYKTKPFDNIFRQMEHLNLYSEPLQKSSSLDLTKPNNLLSSVRFEKKQMGYELKNLRIGQSSFSPKLRLGTFLIYGDLLSSSAAIDQPGQIIHLNIEKITLRHAQPFLLSSHSLLHASHGEAIQKNSALITLPFQTLKSGDIVQGIPKVEQYFEARTTKAGRLFRESLPNLLQALFKRYKALYGLEKAVQQSVLKIQQILVDGVQRVYRSQGVNIADKHLEIVVRQMTHKVQIISGGQTGLFPGELIDLSLVEHINQFLLKKVEYEPIILGITRASLEVDSFLSAASFQQTTKVLSKAAIYKKKDFLKGLKENIIVGNLIPGGTGFLIPLDKQSL